MKALKLGSPRDQGIGMKDTEVRGIVLQKFYEVRHDPAGVLQLPALAELSPANEMQVANVCDQLAQNGLIEWKALRSMGGSIGGIGKITARGVDVIEGTIKSSLAITMRHHNVTITRSAHVQIGNGNIQVRDVTIDKLSAAIDHSNLSETEKAEARSLLEKLTNSSLWSILSSFFPT